MSSVWTKNSDLPEFPSLDKNIKTDVLIIGGGIAGILTGYMLKKAGVGCVIAESDRICHGTTGNTTAKITVLHGFIYDKMIKRFGEEYARLYLKANMEALSEYRRMSESIDCDFESSDAYVYSLDDKEKVQKEVKALKTLGLDARFDKAEKLPFKVAGAVKAENQAQFDPLKFLSHVCRDLEIYESTRVMELTPDGAVCNGGRIKADKIIVATHFPFINTRGSYYLKMYQNRSYVLALEAAETADIIKGMYLEADNLGFSVRSYQNYLLLGGGGHRTGKGKPAWDLLREIAKEYFPEMEERYFWATQDCMSLDKRPYIGPYSKNMPDLFVATGFGKWGMTGSMISAMILSDLVRGKDNAYAAVFSPSRSILRPQLISNLGHALVGIGRIGGKRCTHMGCVLQWNSEEKAWECPCHGSRFGADGNVLENPACNSLKKKH